ncbi:MAG: DUF502 domain-containing protein [Arenicella sp.]
MIISKLRKYLVAGLLVWVPLVVTFLLVKFIIDIVDRTLVLVPAKFRPENLIGYEIPGLGLVLTLLLMLLTGMIVANLFGRRLVNGWEDLLSRIPLVRTIYSSVKQVTSTIFSDSSQSFREVVLVEYPRKGAWMLAFVTGDGPTAFQKKLNQPLVNLFVPTTPNPTSGFYVMVPARDVIRIDIPVEVGLKMILSAGVINPLDDPEEMRKIVEAMQHEK